MGNEFCPPSGRPGKGTACNGAATNSSCPLRCPARGRRADMGNRAGKPARPRRKKCESSALRALPLLRAARWILLRGACCGSVAPRPPEREVGRPAAPAQPAPSPRLQLRAGPRPAPRRLAGLDGARVWIAKNGLSSRPGPPAPRIRDWAEALPRRPSGSRSHSGTHALAPLVAAAARPSMTGEDTAVALRSRRQEAQRSGAPRPSCIHVALRRAPRPRPLGANEPL
mmetsp:Transcript_41299/g.116910  ORF Transcript_41299/g.116910 Transcript_41299/m.116910 type:complete len:227 (+) Transcript_41299:275-955(+)